MKELNSKETMVVSGGFVQLIAGAAVGAFAVDALHQGVCLNVTNTVISTTKSILGFCAGKTVDAYNYFFNAPKATAPVTTVTPIATVETPAAQ